MNSGVLKAVYFYYVLKETKRNLMQNEIGSAISKITATAMILLLHGALPIPFL